MPASLKERVSRRRKVRAAEIASSPRQRRLDDRPQRRLQPHLTGKRTTPPHDALYWRWVAQAAIREGKWKLLRGGDREYLFDLGTDIEEKHNLAAEHPEIATHLRAKLTTWAAGLKPPGLASGAMAPTWHNYYDFYLEGKPAAAEGDEVAPKSSTRKQRRKAQ